MMIIMLVRFVQLTVVLMTGGFLSIGLWGTLSLTQVRTVRDCLYITFLAFFWTRECLDIK